MKRDRQTEMPDRTEGPDEDALTGWLKARAPRIGDDAAFLEAGGPWAVTVDSQREGVHFEAGRSAQAIARRLVAVNNSDMAACGAAPKFAFSTVASPPNFDRKEFFRALVKELSRHQTELAGGDLSSSRQVEVTLTLMGERVSSGRFLRRTSARPGYRIWLCGTAGESKLGLELLARGAHPGRPATLPYGLPDRLVPLARRCLKHHLLPEPKLELGQWLARRRSACAAIDISDGLARDLLRLCRASEVGCRLNLATIPRHKQFDRLAEWLGIDPLVATLAGGEDYALLTCTPSAVRIPARFRCQQIGVIVEPDEGCCLIADAQGLEDLSVYSKLGFDHLA